MIERLCNLLTQTWQYESIRVISEQNEWRAATRQSDNQAIRQLIRQSDSQIIDHANLSILLRASQLPSSDTSNYVCFVPVTDTVGELQRTHHRDGSILTIYVLLPRAFDLHDIGCVQSCAMMAALCVVALSTPGVV
jgi:hypothetical protein